MEPSETFSESLQAQSNADSQSNRQFLAYVWGRIVSGVIWLYEKWFVHQINKTTYTGFVAHTDNVIDIWTFNVRETNVQKLTNCK